jgi:hypothetical protein
MEGLRPSVWSGLPGNVYFMRNLPNHRILWIAEGSLTVQLADENRLITLGKGDRLDLPSGTSYQAVVGAEGLLCVEAHVKSGEHQAIPLNGATNRRQR